MARSAGAIGAVLCLGLPWLSSPAAAQRVEPAGLGASAGAQAVEPPGGRASATLLVRVQVVAGYGVGMNPLAGAGAARAQPGAGGIVVEAGQSRELAIELRREATTAAPDSRRGGLVAAGSVRLQLDATGRARGSMPVGVARALTEARERPGVYVVAIAY